MPVETIGVVNAPAGLNLRQSGSTTALILNKLTKDTELIILAGQGTDWLNVRVRSTGQIGFVAAQYITIRPATGGIDPRPGETGGGGLPVPVKPGFLASESGLFTVALVPSRLLPITSDPSSSTLARIWNNFGGLFETLATRLNIPVSVVVAALAAESGGRTGDVNGRMIVRFENHIFWNLWGKNNADTFNRFFRFNQTGQTWTGHQFRDNEASPFMDFHGNQDGEWRVLTFARVHNDTAALSSISMGAPQVMGFNFARLGYSRVQDMFTAFTSSPRAQLIGIFDFVRGGPAIAALQSGDFLAFARAYNGEGNAQTYANIIGAYNDRFNQLWNS
jgi:hypothetical protein